MKSATRTYHFSEVPACIMCGALASSARVLGIRLNGTQGHRPRAKTGIAVTVCRCMKCGLIFPSPLPQPNSLSDHYGVPAEAYWKEAYFKSNPSYFVRQIKHAKKLLDFKSGMVALDVGVGTGKAAKAMKDADFSVYGVEPSEPFYRRAQEHLGFDSERLRLTTVEDASFPEEFFDFITFGAVLEHLYNPALAIDRAMRWLKPKGILHAEVPSANHLVARIINAYYRLRGTNYITNVSPMHAPFHIHEFTPESFVEHSKRSCYKLEDFYFEVGSIDNIPRPLHPLLRLVMQKSDTGMQLTVWLRKRR